MGFKVPGLWCFGGLHTEHTAHLMSRAHWTSSGLWPLDSKALASLSLDGCPRFRCICNNLACSHLGNRKKFIPCAWLSSESWLVVPSNGIISDSGTGELSVSMGADTGAAVDLGSSSAEFGGWFKFGSADVTGRWLEASRLALGSWLLSRFRANIVMFNLQACEGLMSWSCLG